MNSVTLRFVPIRPADDSPIGGTVRIRADKRLLTGAVVDITEAASIVVEFDGALPSIMDASGKGWTPVHG